ncbi:MAG TPA: hypothetical protein VMT69_15620 [Kineosporiaceae bacterium]|nr:hypothetical protein [Kineosporiaceae bacterium]
MTWWAWTVLWIALVALGAGALYLAFRRLLRQGMALAQELTAAADAFAEVTRALEDGLGPDVVAGSPAPWVRASTRGTT